MGGDLRLFVITSWSSLGVGLVGIFQEEMICEKMEQGEIGEMEDCDYLHKDELDDKYRVVVIDGYGTWWWVGF